MSNLYEIEQLFMPPASGVTLIITVGNSFRSDDGVGPYIAGGIKSIRDHIFLLNAGERPENVIDDAITIGPKRTIIIDAADFNGLPGEMRLIPESAVPDVIHSTHSFPLNIVSRLIAEDTGSEIFFLGIQVASMAPGQGLSAAVRDSAQSIIHMLSGK
jgi:hydrogenase 3 maturation protease